MINDPVPDSFTRALGKRLRQTMKASGVAVKRLAAESGIHYNTALALARGERNPSAWALYKICKSLGVSADWLLGLKGGK